MTPTALRSDDLRERLRSSKRISLMLDRPPRLPMPRYWLVRLYVAMALISNSLVAWLEPASLTAQALRASPAGWIDVALLFALGLVMVVDIAINDYLPPQISMPVAREARHWIYMAASLGTFGLTYAILKDRGYTALLLSYWVDGAFAAAVAALDLFARHRGHA